MVQADGKMGTEQGPQAAGKHGPHEREMASTLAALAAAAPSSGEHPGYLSQRSRAHRTTSWTSDVAYCLTVLDKEPHTAHNQSCDVAACSQT